MSDLFEAMSISSSGMKAQSERTRIISENIANADTTALSPNGTPYTRKTITFKNELDRALGTEMVVVDKVKPDTKTPYPVKYEPGHPAADSRGYVKAPNVNTMLEIMDAREAQRSYEANMGMYSQSREMTQRMIDMLR